MNIYDKARELARELENCEEVVKLRKASENIENSDSNKKVLDDFRTVQMDAYAEQMKNGKISDNTRKRFNDMGAVIMSNPSVNEYIQLEQKFTVMWQDILKILNDAIGIDFSFGVDKNKK
ncbi:YlbF family regulator [Clostridium sp. LBM24168]